MCEIRRCSCACRRRCNVADRRSSGRAEHVSGRSAMSSAELTRRAPRRSSRASACRYARPAVAVVDVDRVEHVRQRRAGTHEAQRVGIDVELTYRRAAQIDGLDIGDMADVEMTRSFIMSASDDAVSVFESIAYVTTGASARS